MWKTIILTNKKKKSSDRGFVTLEIIISLLIAFGFLMVSLQTLVAAMAFKVQAQEKQKADKLIQEDIESIQDIAGGDVLTSRLAAILTKSNNFTFRLNPNNGQPIDDVCDATTYAQGYAQALWYAFTNEDYNDGSYSSPIIDDRNVDNATNPLTDDIALDFMDTGEGIEINPDYEENPEINLLSEVKSNGTKENKGRDITLTRRHVTATTGTTPFRTLGIYYEVTKPDENGDNQPEIIAQRYVEVTPDAALECP